MEKDQLSRKLAVILHADVVDSTSLVQINETQAHERIQNSFRNLSYFVHEYGGDALEIRGDALVANFERASDAVSAALAFQVSNEGSNLDIADAVKPVLRIGVSLGEVVVADDTITGAGVVLAQRLEQLAEPGGLVVQGSITETVPQRLPFAYDDLGEHSLKGFEQPFRAYAVQLKPAHELPPPDHYQNRDRSDTAKTQASQVASIAVLPFTNLSNDPDQDYFSDGMAEDISTALSKVESIKVIACYSMQKYKKGDLDTKKIGKELDVRFALEGSIRKNANRLRISTRLIETKTGHHRWAERYDREVADIFAVQDEITRRIVSELDAQLRIGEQARLWSSGTENFEAWQCIRLSTELLASYKPENMPEAMRLMRQATELDPNYAEAWALLAARHFRESENFDCTKDQREHSLEEAQECINRALATG